jgi:hypothetical protein
MKEYSFEEVIVNIKEGETFVCTDDTYKVKIITRDIIGLKFNNDEPMSYCGINYLQRFVKVETPVSFMEVINYDSKCRVEHELIDKIMNDEENNFNFNEYMEIDEVLFQMTNKYGASETREILSNGKWYLEG